jgi:hypothetical protein
VDKRLYYINELDKMISEVVRLRDKICITCGCEKPLTAGHFMKRRHMATRWNLHNVNGQCWQCNFEDNWEKYREAMIIKYGSAETESIISLGRTETKWSEKNLKELLEIFKKYRALKKSNDGKEKADWNNPG